MRRASARTASTVQIALRISPELRERIKATAEANNRSVNSELTTALEEMYPAPLPENPNDPVLKALVKQIKDLRSTRPTPNSFAYFKLQTYERMARDAAKQMSLFDEPGFIDPTSTNTPEE